MLRVQKNHTYIANFLNALLQGCKILLKIHLFMYNYAASTILSYTTVGTKLFGPKGNDFNISVFYSQN